jgi:membrane-bound lytic murein transglycosylase D
MGMVLNHLPRRLVNISSGPTGLFFHRRPVQWGRVLCLMLAVSLLAAGSGRASVAAAPQANIPALIDSIRITGPLSFCGESVPLDDPEIRERMDKELLLMLWDRAQVILWLKRATRYMPVVESALGENGLPEDLKYIPIVESALLPHAGSTSGAIGFWQFMRATGRRYGLTVNQYIDERRHILFSTRAAIAYLKDLKAQFDSWTLAAAAFNMGEKGLQKEIETQKVDNYYRLYLPLETQRYVFRILAVKLLLANPDAYGFHLTAEDLYPPVAAVPVKVKCRQTTPLMMVADAAQTDFKRIKDLNPHIRGYDLEKGGITLFVPRAAAQGFSARFAELQTAWVRAHQHKVYVVRKGDSLSAIAVRFNIPLSTLLRWNRLRESDPIHPGDRINLFP